MESEPGRLDLSAYLRQEPVVLALLTGMAVVFFLAVSALARIHDGQQLQLARKLAEQGVADLKTQRFAPAVEDFRTALSYSRDNDAYELSLAQALIGLKRYDEAESYLLNLREREPDNGLVSLELARVAVAHGETDQALRFYHNAIYSTWPGNEHEARQRAQLELIQYLLSIQAMPQADAELIDYQASLGDHAGQQIQLGAMFAKVGDYHRALSAYDSSLKLDRHNADALAGMGTASAELGQYGDAERYLRQALAERPGDTNTEARLKQVETVLQWDPFRQQISAVERSQIVLQAFDAAGARLKTCPQLTADEQALQENWLKLKPQLTRRTVRENQDLVNAAMHLAFSVERQTANSCGPQTETDKALLLVANLHRED